MPEPGPDQRVDAVRQFNRFYTRQIGVLHEGLLGSRHSLTEVRVLYELAHRENLTSTELSTGLGLDAGYLSRILRGFAREELIDRKTSQTDARQTLLSLTRRGKSLFAELDARARAEVAAIIKPLSSAEKRSLVEAMRAIERVLGRKDEPRTPYVLRPHQPGDMGWVIHRHGILYNQEYGYDEDFEALVAEIAAKFIQNLDAKRERCWIAEKDGENVGCVFLVKRSNHVAQLRLLLVEPKARGLGIGKRLVNECVRFARQTGYRKMVLWTQSELAAARGIYKEAGFRRAHTERHHSFGKNLVGETWELVL